MKKIVFLLCSIFLFLPLVAIDLKLENSKIDSLILELKDKYVPDTRQEIFDITVNNVGDSIFFSGATTVNKAHKELINETKKVSKLTIIDKIKLLPDVNFKDTLYGIINVSVADIRTQNRFTSGMATQAILGTPIKLLEKDGWYRIQTPDTYFGWAHEKQIVAMNKREFNKWTLAPKVIFTKYYGFAYTSADKNGAIVSDLVAGNVLQYDGIEGEYFKVIYPDKRKAYVLRKESEEYAIWLQSRKPSPEIFVEMAKSMIGIPYVWGGTSTKGMDCSGLVSNIMRLNGLIILRDASQQATVGEVIDISEGYENLKVGDLMFFGEKADDHKKENVRHVGFYLGNLRFIHASGWTRVSSLDPNEADYDELNTKEFIKATRVIDKKGLMGVEKIKDNSFYHIQK